MIGVLKRGLILFSIFFTGTTILSSSLQLYKGQLTDTNFHIINRAAVILIGVITIMLFDKIQLKSKILSYLVPYVMSMGIVFFYVWITGFIEPLHPDAYRDIFLNFTAISSCVMIAIFIKDKWKGSKNKRGQKEHILPL
jgi:hypothetical protein